MSHPSKVKGSKFERDCVDAAIAHGLKSERAWGSDGRSKGWLEVVDMIIERHRYQNKRRRVLPAIMIPEEGVCGRILRADNGKALIVIPYEDYLTLLELERDHYAASTETRNPTATR